VGCPKPRPSASQKSIPRLGPNGGCPAPRPAVGVIPRFCLKGRHRFGLLGPLHSCESSLTSRRLGFWLRRLVPAPVPSERSSLVAQRRGDHRDSRSTLRHSREMTRVCSRKVTHQNDHLAQGKRADWVARGAGDPLVGGIQRPYAPSARMKPPVSSLAHGQGLFFAWVTLSEHKWVTSRERRRSTRGIWPARGRQAYVSLVRGRQTDPLAQGGRVNT
jgi:hypothetical protein